MMKFVVSLLMSLALVQAFTPKPIVGVTRSVSLSKNVMFMAPPAVEEKTEVESDVNGSAVQATENKPEEEKEEMSEAKQLMQKVKDAGTAGVISYALWELGFWFLSVPVCLLGYREVTGHWPDLSNSDDLSKLGAEAFAFVNFARFAVPLRIGLALSTTPWIQENVVDRFIKKDEGEEQ